MDGSLAIRPSAQQGPVAEEFHGPRQIQAEAEGLPAVVEEPYIRRGPALRHDRDGTRAATPPAAASEVRREGDGRRPPPAHTLGQLHGDPPRPGLTAGFQDDGPVVGGGQLEGEVEAAAQFGLRGL
jgi:hypothetical protein